MGPETRVGQRYPGQPPDRRMRFALLRTLIEDEHDSPDASHAGQATGMRRTITTIVAAAALASAGCGENEAADNNAQQNRDSVEPAAQQAPGQRDATELAAETQRLAQQIAQAARDLAADPGVDADQRLQDAERRANQLAEQTEGEDATASATLRDANRWLADAAAELRAAESTEDVSRVLDEQLDQVAEALGDDPGGRVQDELERLRDELGG